MMRAATLLLMLFSLSPLFAQEPQSTPAASLESLNFLLGSWSAFTEDAGSSKAAVRGVYTFRRDLGGHAIQRTSSADACKGPQSFDCQHKDQLSIFASPDGLSGPGLYAFYLDNEGHAIHYVVSVPDSQTALFQSQGPAAKPHFRLTYHLEGAGASAVMHGSFAAAAPGSTDYRPYLVWSGTRQ